MKAIEAVAVTSNQAGFQVTENAATTNRAAHDTAAMAMYLDHGKPLLVSVSHVQAAIVHRAAH
jgi:hypothetical protein